jgi:hypothetical protein
VEPRPFGTVLAMLVDRAGKPVRDGSLKGQLYATPAGLAVLRPPRWQAVLHLAANALLIGSVVAVVGNVLTVRRMAVIWVAMAAQAAYWLTLSWRRRMLDPVPLSPEALEAARRAGRVAISVPIADLVHAEPPEPPRRGLRRPARFVLAEGALEIYLSEAQFAEVRAALGR